jgi:hypothetical protein
LLRIPWECCERRIGAALSLISKCLITAVFTTAAIFLLSFTLITNPDSPIVKRVTFSDTERHTFTGTPIEVG